LQAAVPLVYIPLEAVVSKWYGESEKMLAGEREQHKRAAPCNVVLVAWHCQNFTAPFRARSLGDGRLCADFQPTLPLSLLRRHAEDVRAVPRWLHHFPG
jgi:hypothetical protein